MSIENADIKSDENVSSPQNNLQQPLGLVPLYPFPAIPSAEGVKKPQNFAFPGLGFTFLPPIHQSAYNYGRLYFTDKQLDPEVEDLLEEVIVEESLGLLEEVITEGVEPSVNAIRRNLQLQRAKEDRLCKEIAVELIDEVLKQECYHSVIEFYDDLIAKHREKVDLYHVASNLFAQLEIEAVKEATEDIWIGCLCGETCSSLVHDVLMEELSTVAEEVLMHYGARLALSQFKQISKLFCDRLTLKLLRKQLSCSGLHATLVRFGMPNKHKWKSASDVVLNSMCLQLLLPKPPPPAQASLAIIDHMMMEVLLKQLVELGKPTGDECMPLQWFKKKLVSHVALDLVLDDLCQELDKFGESDID